MEHISELLGRYTPDTPDESTLLKRYIEQEFKAHASIVVKEKIIIITVASASLANTLRLRGRAIQKLAGTTKRLVFRIG